MLFQPPAAMLTTLVKFGGTLVSPKGFRPQATTWPCAPPADKKQKQNALKSFRSETPPSLLKTAFRITLARFREIIFPTRRRCKFLVTKVERWPQKLMHGNQKTLCFCVFGVEPMLTPAATFHTVFQERLIRILKRGKSWWVEPPGQGNNPGCPSPRCCPARSTTLDYPNWSLY